MPLHRDEFVLLLQRLDDAVAKNRDLVAQAYDLLAFTAQQRADRDDLRALRIAEGFEPPAKQPPR